MLKQAIDGQGIKGTKVLLTHGHVDHASAAAPWQSITGEDRGAARDDLFLIEACPSRGEVHFPAYKPFVPDRWRRAGDISLGNQTTSCTAGHTPGHVVFVHRRPGSHCGRRVFRGSIGRTDFPRGNPISSTSIRAYGRSATTSVRARSWQTSTGWERKTNPVADYSTTRTAQLN